MYGITLKDVTLQSTPNPLTNKTKLKLIHAPTGIFIEREETLLDDNQLKDIVAELQSELEPKIEGHVIELSQEERDMVSDNVEWMVDNFDNFHLIISNYVCGLMEGRFTLDQGIRQIYASKDNDDIFNIER